MIFWQLYTVSFHTDVHVFIIITSKLQIKKSKNCFEPFTMQEWL